MLSSCSVDDSVKTFNKLYRVWVTGKVTYIYDNGDVQVVGVDSWEGTVIRCNLVDLESV